MLLPALAPMDPTFAFSVLSPRFDDVVGLRHCPLPPQARLCRRVRYPCAASARVEAQQKKLMSKLQQAPLGTSYVRLRTVPWQRFPVEGRMASMRAP